MRQGRWILATALVAAIAAAAAGVWLLRPAPPEAAQVAPISSSLIPIPPIPVPPGAISKGDRENYFNGPYIAFASDFSVSATGLPLRHGLDYRDTIIIREATFPAGTEIHWRWPKTPVKAGVYGYMHLAYGYYSGGVPQQPVAPIQVAALGQLKTRFDVAVDASGGDFNVLSETFLTAKPADVATKTLEVGFLTRVSQSGRRFFDQAEQLGTWTDPSGRVWEVAIVGGYCMFIPLEGEMNSGELDYAAAFRWLVAKGRLTGREWFNGLAIGIEPTEGGGSMSIRRWDVIYQGAGAS